MDRRVVSSWLQSVLTPYGDPPRAYSDIMTVLDSLPSLSPRTELYISNMGQSSLLVQLRGTVPIQFKGNTYNIPVEVWIPKAYPRQVPMCYVTPTKEMNVRKTQHVDLDGFVSGGDYIQNWERKWETKSLFAFIQACQESFAHQPPVYAKPREDVNAAASTSASPSPAASLPSLNSPGPSTNGSGSTSKPPPPLPNTTSSPATPSPGPPLRPPKPGGQQQRAASGDFSYEPQQQRAYHGSYDAHHQQVPPIRRDTYPQRQQQQYTSPAHQPGSPQQPQHGHSHYQQPQHPQFQHHQHSVPYQSQSYDYHSQQHLQQHHHQQQHQQPPPLPQHQQTSHPPDRDHTHSQQQQPPAPALFSRPPRDLLDEEDEDDKPAGVSHSGTSASHPAPARPPNPELYRLHMALHAKLASRVSSIHSSLSTSNDHLRVLASDLDSGPPAIEDELARLTAVREVCKTRAERVEATVESAHRRAEELEARPQPPPSEIVLADSIVGDQLVSLLSSDLALTDTLYHLSRALQSEQLDLDRYLKWVRLYGREQFLKRALARKIRLGLEGHVG